MYGRGSVGMVNGGCGTIGECLAELLAVAIGIGILRLRFCFALRIKIFAQM